MNIGLYISPSHTVPPDEKNILAPWILVRDLANGLTKDRHAVTLFAAKGTKTDARLVHGGIRPTVHERQRFGDVDSYRAYVIAQELLLFREVIAEAKAGSIDLIHIHQPVERLYPALAALPPKFPVVITFHDPLRPERFPALEKVYTLGNIHFVSLSRAQQEGVPFPFEAVVPNGVDMKLFKPDRELHRIDPPLLMTGRIVPQKGFTDAIRVAGEAGVRLMIIGQEYTKKKIPREYFEEEVLPAIDGKHVIWESVVRTEHLVGHYQTARALLFPIHWEEPFGLVMVEAMACGTPVIAFDRGSVSEIVKDGLTGFIIEDDTKSYIGKQKNHWKITKKGIEGFVEAVKRIGEIDRKACRAYAEKTFPIVRMIKAYEAVYKRVVS